MSAFEQAGPSLKTQVRTYSCMRIQEGFRSFTRKRDNVRIGCVMMGNEVVKIAIRRRRPAYSSAFSYTD